MNFVFLQFVEILCEVLEINLDFEERKTPKLSHPRRVTDVGGGFGGDLEPEVGVKGDAPRCQLGARVFLVTAIVFQSPSRFVIRHSEKMWLRDKSSSFFKIVYCFTKDVLKRNWLSPFTVCVCVCDLKVP